MNTIQLNIFNKTQGDRTIWVIASLLASVSMLSVYSASNMLAYNLDQSSSMFLFKQSMFIAIGFGVMYFAHKVNYMFYAQIASILFYISIPLLIYTYFFGLNINDASRWIKVPGINLTIQTSDIAKISLWMYLSKILAKQQDKPVNSLKEYRKFLFPILIICGLIMPSNLSTAILTGITGLLILFIGRIPFKYLFLTILVGSVPVFLIVGIAYYKHHHPNSLAFIENVARLETWVNRVDHFIYTDQSDMPMQSQQAHIAIAKGGLLGKGPGNSQQRNFLPNPFSDFIYVIIIEEYGMLGAGALLLLYLFFLFRCMVIFRRTPFAFGAILSISMSFALVMQALVNMMVNVGLLPVTGIVLPLVSMGGSSYFFNCFSIGVILSVARNLEVMEGDADQQKNINPAIA